MRVSKFRVSLFIAICFISYSCTTNTSKIADQDPDSIQSDTFLTDSLTSKDSSIIEIDPFMEMVNAVKDTLKFSSFNLDTIIQTVENLEDHWWLKGMYRAPDYYKRINKPIPAHFPTANDFKKIKNIQQAIFKRAWKIHVEEWQMESVGSAEKWLSIINSKWQNEYTKPPKIVWTEGSNLYFIMSTAAADWFSLGDMLVNVITKRERALLQYLFDPLDLETFKKTKGPSLSGLAIKRSYYLTPDTTGLYYYYTLFNTPSNLSEVQRTNFKIVVFKYDSIIGDFYDTNEELIEFKIKFKDTYMPWAFHYIGQQKHKVIEMYGNPQVEVNQSLLFGYSNRALVYHFQNDTINWIKFSRLNRPFDSSDESLMSDLTEF